MNRNLKQVVTRLGDLVIQIDAQQNMQCIATSGKSIAHRMKPLFAEAWGKESYMEITSFLRHFLFLSYENYFEHEGAVNFLYWLHPHDVRARARVLLRRLASIEQEFVSAKQAEHFFYICSELAHLCNISLNLHEERKQSEAPMLLTDLRRRKQRQN